MLRKMLIAGICAIAAATGVHLTLANDATLKADSSASQAMARPIAANKGANKAGAGTPSPRQPLQNWVDANVKPGEAARLDASDGKFTVSGPVQLPAGTRLTIAADLVGRGKAPRLVLLGDAELIFSGSKLHNVPIKLSSGRVTIRGLRYSGRISTAAIMIPGPGPYNDLLIEDIEITDANYGILRRGSHSSLTGGTIRRAHFARLHGDAIEWNVVPRDRGLLIEDITIDGIDDPQGRPNWGIGIGVAGRYDAEWADAQTASDFVIRNVKGRAMRQLVHVEGAKRFRVENVTASDISPRYSARSNMHSAAFACYGCRDFTVSNLTADSGGMKIFAGVRKGVYINPSRDFTLSNIQLGSGDIDTQLGGAGSFGVMQNVKLDAGTLKLRGALQRLDMSNVRVTSAGRDSAPLVEEPNWLAGRLFGLAAPARGGKREGLVLQRGRQ